MTTYSPEEMETRLSLVKPIVEAAYSIRGIALGEEKIAAYAEHWEAAFGRIATPQLRDLYRVGLEKRATTAEEFVAFWEMQTNAEAEARAHAKTLAKRAALEKVPVNIPQFILDNWGVAQ